MGYKRRKTLKNAFYNLVLYFYFKTFSAHRLSELKNSLKLTRSTTQPCFDGWRGVGGGRHCYQWYTGTGILYRDNESKSESAFIPDSMASLEQDRGLRIQAPNIIIQILEQYRHQHWATLGPGGEGGLYCRGMKVLSWQIPPIGLLDSNQRVRVGGGCNWEEKE